MSTKKWRSGFDSLDNYRLPNQTVVEPVEEEKPNPLAPYYDTLRADREKQYKTDLSALDSSRNLERQEAAINNELLKKYMPQINQMSGLSGLGVSESANLDNLSRYQTTLSDINRRYKQSESDLSRYYRSDLADINALERAEQREDQQNAYGVALEHIGSGAITDADTLKRYLTAVTPSVSDIQLQQLKALGESLVGETEAKKGATGSSISTEGTVTIPFVPKEGQAPGNFTLYLGGETQNQGALSMANYRNDGETFLYGDNIYVKQAGHVYELVDGNGGKIGKAYTDAYNYLKNGTVPDTRPVGQMPSTDPYEYNPYFDPSAEVQVDVEGKYNGSRLALKNVATPWEKTVKNIAKKRNIEEGSIISISNDTTKMNFVILDDKVYEVE